MFSEVVQSYIAQCLYDTNIGPYQILKSALLAKSNLKLWNI